MITLDTAFAFWMLIFALIDAAVAKARNRSPLLGLALGGSLSLIGVLILFIFDKGPEPQPKQKREPKIDNPYERLGVKRREQPSDRGC